MFYLPRSGRPPFPDARIRCSNGSLLAHRAILGIYSPLLKAILLHHENKDDEMPTIVFADYNVQQVGQFLDILYGQTDDEERRRDNDLFESLRCHSLPMQKELKAIKSEIVNDYEEALDFRFQDVQMVQDSKVNFSDDRPVRVKAQKNYHDDDYDDPAVEPYVEIKDDGKYLLPDEDDEEEFLDFDDSDFGYKSRKRKRNGKGASKRKVDRPSAAKRFHESSELFPCEECGKEFKTERSLVDHKVKGHREKKPKQQKITCEQCSKELPNEKKYKKHLNVCGKRTDPVPFTCVLNPDNPLVCPKEGCDFTADKPVKVKHHYRKTHETRMCSYCGMLVLFYSLKAHIAEEHTKEFQYKCSFCGKGFVTQRQLDEHRERIHIQLPTYVCDLCGKGLLSKRLLTNHKFEAHYFETHDDKCPHCKQAFRDRKRLSKHKKLCAMINAGKVQQPPQPQPPPTAHPQPTATIVQQ